MMVSASASVCRASTNWRPLLAGVAWYLLLGTPGCDGPMEASRNAEWLLAVQTRAQPSGTVIAKT